MRQALRMAERAAPSGRRTDFVETAGRMLKISRRTVYNRLSGDDEPGERAAG